MRRTRRALLAWGVLTISTLATAAANVSDINTITPFALNNLFPRQLGVLDDRPKDCPPCFNCNLEDFACQQFGNCTHTSGRCSCPPGFGDVDCSKPLCGSLGQKDRRPRAENEQDCACDDGWEGINCNVCTKDKACDPLMSGREDGVCYRQGLVQKENFQMCDVTNRKIVDMLNPKKPQVTFSCNTEREDCNFQFWVDKIESFYCQLDTCSFKQDVEETRNTTIYKCDTIKCKCIPDRMLCGQDGSINISEFLQNQIKGPASFTTISTDGGSAEDGSAFSEPQMNILISSVFGDKSITLACDSGECLYKTEVPGFEKPVKKINTPLIAGVIAGCALFIVAVILAVWWYTRRRNADLYAPIHLSEDGDDEDSKLMADHRPAALHFENVSYALKGRQILSGVQGAVHPGELLAIMGASGAGKTTFLDILARKNKRGSSGGQFYVNGEKYPDEEFRSVIGFVDQDDTMLATLTVHETILDSAMLRLPREMSYASKAQRVDEVEKQLGIFHIRDQVIGSEEGGRGISGGEKRRVSIACELVTSPSILFLDEPTSGLDAYNAYNVVECLVNLVKTYNRTVVFTIHQPRSNIVALFDQLIILARGRAVYSGPLSSCQAYFDGIGYACPPGFNIADYLIDLTMHAGVPREPMDDMLGAENDEGFRTGNSSTRAIKSIPSMSTLSVAPSQDTPEPPAVEPAARLSLGGRKRTTSIRQLQEIQLFTRKKPAGNDTPPTARSEDNNGSYTDSINGGPPGAWLKMSRTLKDSQDLPFDTTPTGTKLDELVASYAVSNVANAVREDIKETMNAASSANSPPDSSPQFDGGMNGHGQARVKGYHRVGILTQFVILSVRTWRNLYRNPMLMLTHYAISIVLAVFLGFLFYGLTDDIAGFQNRLGLFFFVLALFGFSTLTSLTVFAPERLLFVRERAKGYYKPISYFLAKMLFDIIPLRLIPPIILGAIVYPMTGLVPAWGEFFKFILFLVLFNLAAAAICLFLGIVFKNGGVANLIGILVMLFSLLFSGFFLNQGTIPKAVLWLQSLSIFHYSFEGVIVNEAKYLSLTDHKYGLDIEVPGSAILSSFGFDVQALWWDVLGLGIFGAVFVVVAYVAMHFLLIERR